jgi:hypothetical protein
MDNFFEPMEFALSVGTIPTKGQQEAHSSQQDGLFESLTKYLQSAPRGNMKPESSSEARCQQDILFFRQ